jgi:hypothetical protein
MNIKLYKLVCDIFKIIIKWYKMTTNERITKLTYAFEIDNYSVETSIVEFEDKIGIKASHNTATDYDTKQPKKVYYLEGDHYQMGYMLGLLAEPDVELMATDFADSIIISFINGDKPFKHPEIEKIIGAILIEIVNKISKKMNPTIPVDFKQEIAGILDGCKKANPKTKVTTDHLFALNFGIDILLSFIYTGDLLLEKMPFLKPEMLKLSIMCNAFSVFGAAANGNHFFGRDFMFPTAGVFQDTACMIIYNPVTTSEIPHISMTAPGMIGSIAAINLYGIGVGVDMSPSGNCTPNDVGLNSLPMLRYVIQQAKSAQNATEIMQDTPRGVSWDYIISDGTNDKACIVEAGSSTANPDFLAYPPERFKKWNLLPNQQYINDHQTVQLVKGLMVRWNDYLYPESYLNDFNKKLWRHYNLRHCKKIKLYPDGMAENGYINKTYTEKNCPDDFYFAPQRETRDDYIVVSNHFVIPEMRLYAMHEWTAAIVKSEINDIQWRYDELNNEVLSALQNGPIDYDTAKNLIDFLAPYGKFPDYYSKKNPRSKDGKEIRIEGSVSICDLKNKTMESHFGYYCDEWIKLTLPNYIF